MRCICHLDMDAFYASVEQRDHPNFQGHPVVVGADPKGGAGRGVVAACSYEARRYGIRSALPIGQAFRLCPAAIFVRPRMSHYLEVSRRIRQLLQGLTPLVEPLSIDEAFLDLTARVIGETGSERGEGWFEAAERMGADLKRTIREQVNLTASVGIAPNKFVAKVASDLRKPDGLVVVRPGEVQAFLDPLPVSRLWGVGPKTSERLYALGIRQIHQLRAMDPALLVSRLGRLGHQLWQLSAGEDRRAVVTSRAARSISRERTFGEDTREQRLLEETLRRLAQRVAADLERHQLTAGTVVLKLRYSDFTTFTRQMSPRLPVIETVDLEALVLQLFRLHWNPTLTVRLVGLGVARLRPRAAGQLSLF
jgi:DNA polymerase IV